ncbi:hypothetical protein HDU93_009974 [Gonapodya sp. JEL0774]|nr:hypothetical protein HDU93_009974 [Gonapodya sp. JEL0774]
MGGACCKEELIDFSQEVELNHFHLLRVVGKGAFGKVRIVQHKQNKEIWALKYINKEQCIAMKAIDNIIQERKMLEEINHPFICNLRYAFQDDENLFMVIDLMLGGDMRFHLERVGRFSEDAVRLYMAECALALSYLHKEKRIVHRDLKPDNILLDVGGHAHLTDFNIAVKLRDDRPLTAVAGSMAYMAPEIFVASAEREKEREKERQKRKEKERLEKEMKGETVEGDVENKAADADGKLDKEGGGNASTDAMKAKPEKEKETSTGTPNEKRTTGYNESVDWWSLGVVMYELLFEKRPFHGKTNELLQKAIMHDALEMPPEASKLSAQCVDCMKGFLTRDISQRLGCKEAGGIEALKQHPFFAGLDWGKVFKKEITPAFVPDPNSCNFDASHELEELLLEDNPLRAKPRKHKPPTISAATAPADMADAAAKNPQLMAQVHITTQASIAPGGQPTDYGLSKEMMEMEMKFTVFDYKNAKIPQTAMPPSISAPSVPQSHSMSSLNEPGGNARTPMADAGVKSPSPVRIGLEQSSDPSGGDSTASQSTNKAEGGAAGSPGMSGVPQSGPNSITNFFGSIRRRRSSKGGDKPAPLLKAPTVVVSSDSKGDLVVGVGETGGVPVIQGSVGGGSNARQGATEAM